LQPETVARDDIYIKTDKAGGTGRQFNANQAEIMRMTAMPNQILNKRNGQKVGPLTRTKHWQQCRYYCKTG
jgi:hypothetical protein